MPKVLPQIQALNLYFESSLWLVCSHADRVPSSMLACTFAACRNLDVVDFEQWCDLCQITIASTKTKITPLSDTFAASQSEMTEDEIFKHNEAALNVIDSFPDEIVQKPTPAPSPKDNWTLKENLQNAALEHVGTDGGGE